jgi:hypothetical protein
MRMEAVYSTDMFDIQTTWIFNTANISNINDCETCSITYEREQVIYIAVSLL